MKRIILPLFLFLISCILFGQTNHDYIIDSKGTKYEVDIISISADSVISFTVTNAPGKIRNIRIDHIKEFYLSDQSKWSTNTFNRQEQPDISNNTITNTNDIDGEYLVERAHGIPRDQMLRLLLSNNGIDENSPIEKVQEIVSYYYEHEDELLYGYDVERHRYLVEGVSQARAQRQAEWGRVFTGMVSGLSQVVDNAQRQASAEREAKKAQAEYSRQQKIQERIAADQQAQNIARQSSQEAANSLHSSTSAALPGYAGSKNDLYTSDPAWNKTVDLMVQQHGLEKTSRMVQEMKASNSQAANQSTLSSYQTSYGTGDPDGTILSAITTNRTMIYINVKGGSVTHYAWGKDILGKYNWNFVGSAPITNINMTPYDTQFGKEYSRAANISGLGYVFFN